MALGLRAELRAGQAVACARRTNAPAHPAAVVPVLPSRGDKFFNLSQKVPSSQPARGSTIRVAATATDAVPHWKLALEELDKPKDGGRKVLIAQVAPAVRVAIAESFGLAPGAVSPGKLAAGLRALGFDQVFDTLFAADLTIMEEGTELLHRLKEHLEAHPHSDEPLPMFTSCCPGWVAMMEKSYPELIPFVSSCKSPQMMMGAMVKTYLSEKQGIPAKDIVMVSVMPCVRKQGEADREWFCVSEPGVRDVDHVITTAELGNIFKERGIILPELPDSDWDQPLGLGSGAGVLFGTTGGVMEAAVRTAYEIVTKEPLPRLNLSEVRGLDGIKEASVTLVPAPGSKFAELVAARLAHKVEEAAAAEAAAAVEGAVKPPIAYDGGQGFSTDDGKGGLKLRVAVANGLGNAKKLIGKMVSGEAKYDFVEIMACPAGCVGGGGQPRSTDKQITQKRQAALYDLDERNTLRRSHENEAVNQLYKEFLGEPLSHRAHELLHTHYVPGGAEADA
uniref:Iron-hydrogenase HydA2 n=1 Tax=Chlamydomonas reinhardtii TaxID=3055 RepID=Q6T532_CHLRE|nr:iron-hydrogenase HydA2 [Chlamydomonas reinhardtii]